MQEIILPTRNILIKNIGKTVRLFYQNLLYNLIWKFNQLDLADDMESQILDIDKSLEALVYISHKTNNLINILKILYFADKYHLQQYGRLITGDKYIAMENGPVPSGAYDLIKYVRGDGIFTVSVPAKEALKVEDKIKVTPLRAANMDYLSESDVECLNHAIDEIANMGFNALKRKSHNEKPYKDASQNGDISLESIALSLDNGKDILDYLKE
jgi:uncharacterized phage-associated protein